MPTKLNDKQRYVFDAMIRKGMFLTCWFCDFTAIIPIAPVDDTLKVINERNKALRWLTMAEPFRMACPNCSSDLEGVERWTKVDWRSLMDCYLAALYRTAEKT